MGLGTKLLSNWETTRKKMAWIMPKALLQYQDAEEILSARSRKELVDELSNALAKHQITELKLAWKNAEPVHGGLVPQYGEQEKNKKKKDGGKKKRKSWDKRKQSK